MSNSWVPAISSISSAQANKLTRFQALSIKFDILCEKKKQNVYLWLLFFKVRAYSDTKEV